MFFEVFLSFTWLDNCSEHVVRVFFKQIVMNFMQVTLPAEMFWGSDFWLETRVIIKISKKMIPHMKPKFFFIKKKEEEKKKF